MDRCSKCNKKSMIVFSCTCKKIFCTKCRMPEDHGCTFDYRAAFKELNTLKNPKVKATKVETL